MNFGDIPNVVFSSSNIEDGNMSFVFELKKKVKENRVKFFKNLSVKINEIVVLDLEHKDSVCLISKKDLGNMISGDALITGDKNAFPAILTADCLPVAVYDPENEVISLIHVSVNNIDTIIDKTISILADEFNTKPSSLIIEIGPSVGPCHYKKDLWKQAGDVLVRNGVLEQNISNKKVCTYENNYFSHRRSKDNNEPEGRFLTIFGIRD